MNSLEHIRKNHATRVMNELEIALARRTQECLTATCLKRIVFQKKHNRPPTPEECSKKCQYNPNSKSLPGQTRRRNS